MTGTGTSTWATNGTMGRCDLDSINTVQLPSLATSVLAQAGLWEPLVYLARSRKLRVPPPYRRVATHSTERRPGSVEAGTNLNTFLKFELVWTPFVVLHMLAECACLLFSGRQLLRDLRLTGPGNA